MSNLLDIILALDTHSSGITFTRLGGKLQANHHQDFQAKQTSRTEEYCQIIDCHDFLQTWHKTKKMPLILHPNLNFNSNLCLIKHVKSRKYKKYYN